MSEVIPDCVLVVDLLPSSRDTLKALDIEVAGLKYWRHFGEVLLGWSDINLRMLERSSSPSLAIVDNWTALNPEGLVRDLISALKQIQREDVATTLRAAVLKFIERKCQVTNGGLVARLSEEETNERTSASALPPFSAPASVVSQAAPCNASLHLDTQRHAGSDPVIWTERAIGPEVVKAVIRAINSLGMFPDDHGFLRRIAYVETRDGQNSGTVLGGIWKISEDMLIDTQRIMAHGQLIRKHKIIQQKLNIDWPEVIWRDLQKPIYSALAARLFLSNNPRPIPETLERQGRYWKINYNPGCTLQSDAFVRDVMNLEQSKNA